MSIQWYISPRQDLVSVEVGSQCWLEGQSGFESRREQLCAGGLWVPSGVGVVGWGVVTHEEGNLVGT